MINRTAGMELLVKSLLICMLVPRIHSTITLDRRTIDGAWYQFKLRDYVIPAEDFERREAFKESLRYVIVKNIAHELTGDEYRAGLNCASKLTPRERVCSLIVDEKATGVSSDSAKPADENGHGYSSISSKINPSSIDWVARDRVLTPGCQACGDCYAWAATYALSSALAIQRNMPAVNLSVQEAKDCSYDVYRTPTNITFNNGCNGGNVHIVYSGLKGQTQYSMTLTDKYEQYNNRSGPLVCNTALATLDREVTLRNHTWRGPPVYDTDLENQLQNGPVAARMCMSNAAGQWKIQNNNAVYNDSSCYTECQNETMVALNLTVPPNGNHAVLIVGYTRTTWIVQNSHGPNWGANGIGHFTRQIYSDGTRVCNLAYQIYWPIL